MEEQGSAPSSRRSRKTRAFMRLARKIFSLKLDIDYSGTVEQIRSDVELRAGYIWSLVFAILIASVGLNVNSTAVIIGAMLISPLMGPIVGAGFGLAIHDLVLVRRSFRYLLIAIIVAIITSTLYFAISPLGTAQSELLARTRPTLYDVLIALFGGSAGAVAVTRKTNKGNVVSGVAIATALMPPLCTAGYGIAQWNLGYFLGALHLFLINALFIFLATLGFIRLMNFRFVREVSRKHVIRTRTIILIITGVIALPSVYTAWVVVKEARFEQAVRRFVSDNLNFGDQIVINVDSKYSLRGSMLSATLLGHKLSESTIQSLEQRLKSYGLEGTRLILRQASEEQPSVEQISHVVRQGIIEDLFKRNEDALASRDARIRILEDEVVKLRSMEFKLEQISKELIVLYPGIISIGMGQQMNLADSGQKDSPTYIIVAVWRQMPAERETEKLRSYLSLRLSLEQLRLVNISAK